MKARPLLLLALATAPAGCFTPSPVVRLTPEDPGVVWRDGRAIVSRAGPGYRTAVAFEEASDQFSFRVEVANTGADRCEVDPARMVYIRCTQPRSCYSPRSVVDPEGVLLALDQARAREKASEANQQVASGVFLLLDATAAVVSVASGDHKGASQALRAADETAAQSDQATAASEASIAGLESRRERWATVSLRRSTLFAGQAVAGMVYLPIDLRATRVWLNVRLGEHDNWFAFRQEVISSEPTYRPSREPDTY